MQCNISKSVLLLVWSVWGRVEQAAGLVRCVVGRWRGELLVNGNVACDVSQAGI